MRASWCLLSLLLFSPVFSQSPDRALEPRNLDNESFIEIFTFTAQHPDQTFIQIQMTITNLGIGDRNATCKMLVLPPGEGPKKGQMYYGPKDWAFSDSSGQSLTVGPLRIQSLPTGTVFTGSLDSITIRIALDGTLSPVKPPNAANGYEVGTSNGIKAKGDFYEYRTLVPWSVAHTSLTLPGRPEQQLQGRGMLEHSRSVGNPKEISRGWVTYRGWAGDAYLIANFRMPVDKALPAIGWIWKSGMAGPAAMTGLQVEAAPTPASRDDAPRYTVTALDSSFRITSGTRLCRYSFIDELGPFLGDIVKIVVGNPVTSYYRATAQTSKKGPTLQGFLELMRIE